MKRQRWAAILSVVICGWAAYAGSFAGVFALDDPTSISDNPTLRDLGNWRAVLTPLRGHGRTVGGRPVLNLSLAVNYAVSGTDVWSYHLVNLAIHLGAGLALFGVLRRLTGRIAFAWAVALIWVVHPLNTEAVTYIVQRAESLMGLFYLFTLYCFVRYAGVDSRAVTPGAAPRNARGHWAVLSVLACFLGMATKEVMVSVPLAVLLVDRLTITGSFSAAWRERRGYYLALASSWLLLGGLVWHTGDRGGTSGFGSGVSVFQYWLTQPPAIARYLRLAIWPHPLVIDYGTEWVQRPSAILVAGALIFACLTGTIYGLVRNRPWGLLGFVFFAVLAPTSLIPGNRQTAAEHRMYLALIPVIVGALAWVQWKRPPVVLAAVVALALAGATFLRNHAYASTLALYGDAVAKMPGNAYAQTNYGTALLFDQQYGDAIVHLQEAVRLQPGLAEAGDNLGNAYFDLGQFREAEIRYRQVIAQHPEFAEAHDNLAEAFLREGRYAEARREATLALQIDPDLPEAHDSLGKVLLAEGRGGEAIGNFARATELAPLAPEHWLNFGNALRADGKAAAAADAYARAARLDPQNAAIYYDWAGALSDLHRYPEAERDLRRALQIDPANASAHQNLGNALLADHQAPAAVEEYAAAARLRPNDAVVRYNLGNGLLQLNRREAAIQELQAALRLNPKLTAARDLLRALGASATSE
jgi:tetratricopeptide (TPR) repeat protein